MSVVLAELRPELAHHLAAALVLYREDLRRRGHRVPPDLDQLLMVAAKIARSRQPDDSSRHDPAGCPSCGDHAGMSYDRAARYLGVSPRTLSRAVKAGDLTPTRLGRRVTFTRASLDAYRDAS